MAKLFAQVTGVVLLALGIIGFVTGDYVFGLNSSTMEDLLHVVLGLISLYAGFAGGDSLAIKTARVLGPAYILVAIIGFINPSIGGLWNPDLRTPDHLVHLVLGLIGTYVGYKSVPANGNMARS
ncbi:MAG: DUF4383 domain-containing protein [bacterium]|nr:DUF4383 domain-containing protein [bacterium]